MQGVGCVGVVINLEIVYGIVLLVDGIVSGIVRVGMRVGRVSQVHISAVIPCLSLQHVVRLAVEAEVVEVTRILPAGQGRVCRV